MSDSGKRYGTEFRALYTRGNIKYIKYNSSSDQFKTPMETMTPNRIYAVVGRDGEVKSIVRFDKKNKRYKQIDILGTPHSIDGKPTLPHAHIGYFHAEYGGTKGLSERDKKLVEKVLTIWQDRDK